MKILFILLVFALSISVSGQGYSVYYRTTGWRPIKLLYMGEIKDVNDTIDYKERLVFDTAFSICYSVGQGNDRYRNKKTFDEKIKQHRLWYSRSDSALYRDATSQVGKIKYLVGDTANKCNYSFLDGTKEILGYQCNTALLVSNRDSVLIWYTKKIPYPYGPVNYTGLPGVILGFSYLNKNLKTLATEIDTGDYKVVLPEKAIRLSAKEYYNRNPKLKPKKQ